MNRTKELISDAFWKILEEKLCFNGVFSIPSRSSRNNSEQVYHGAPT